MISPFPKITKQGWKTLDEMIETHTKRQKAFQMAGLNYDEAFDLAEQMWERDLDLQDDRRVCFECKHYKDEKCEAIRTKFDRPSEPLRFILQRCDHFKLKGTK
jgi:hypothetical protein